MNETELNKLNAKMMAHKPTTSFGITTFDWSDNDLDRTLLYGYDVDRNTWHVYVKDKRVYLYAYNYDGACTAGGDTFTSFQDLIPNKRLYPERCDYEFALWLIRDKGCHMTFLKWDRNLAANIPTPKPYHGEVEPTHRPDWLS